MEECYIRVQKKLPLFKKITSDYEAFSSFGISKLQYRDRTE